MQGEDLLLCNSEEVLLTSSCSVEEGVSPCEGTLADACPLLQQLLHHRRMATVGSIVQCC